MKNTQRSPQSQKEGARDSLRTKRVSAIPVSMAAVTHRGARDAGNPAVHKEAHQSDFLDNNQGKVRFMVYQDMMNAQTPDQVLERLIKDTNQKVFLILDNLEHIIASW
ncbi:MAG: hypothetical protein R2861_03630 [Desulfobacterales bacterium]